MHEASLIQNLLEIVLESAAANGITRVKRVYLVVGEGHGVPIFFMAKCRTLWQLALRGCRA